MGPLQKKMLNSKYVSSPNRNDLNLAVTRKTIFAVTKLRYFVWKIILAKLTVLPRLPYGVDPKIKSLFAAANKHPPNLLLRRFTRSR